MKNLMVLLTGGTALALAVAFTMNVTLAGERDKPQRDAKSGGRPEAGKRRPAPESARGQGERRPRDGDRGERGPRDGAQRNRGPQDRGPGRSFDPPRFPLMEALDADRDGQLSAEEIEGAAAALKTLDKNNDGKLTPDEFAPKFRGPGGRGHMRGPGHDSGGPRPDGDRPERPEASDHPRGQDMAERLMAMDVDEDGKVSEEEMPERMRRLLDRIDTNGDGAIDEEEAQKAAERFNRSDRPRGARPGGDRPSRP